MSNFNKIYDHINKLSNVYRFAGKRVDSQYNVAEHSYRVAVLAMLVVDQYNKENSIQIDKAEVLSKALLHDIEEAVFNDIPAPIHILWYENEEDYINSGGGKIITLP